MKPVQRSDLGSTLAAWLLSLVLMQMVALAMHGAPLDLRLVAQTTLAIGLPAWWLTRTHDARRGARAVGRVPGGWSWAVMMAALAGVGLACAGSAFLVGVDRTLGEAVPLVREILAARDAFFLEALALDDVTQVPRVLLVFALLPALFEEALYRGAMRSRLAGRSEAVRVGWVTVLFATAHLDPFAFLPLLLAGGTFAWFAERSDGLALPMVAHFALNAMGSTVLPRLQVGEPSDWMGPVPVGLAGLALWVMALTGARLLFQRSKVGPQATGSA